MFLAMQARLLVARWLKEGPGHAAALERLLAALSREDTTPLMRALLVRALPYFAHRVRGRLGAIQDILRSALAGRLGSLARLGALAAISGARIRTVAMDMQTRVYTLETSLTRKPLDGDPEPVFGSKFARGDLPEGLSREIVPLLDERRVFMTRAAVQALTELRERGAMEPLWKLFLEPGMITSQRRDVIDFLARFPHDDQAQEHIVAIVRTPAYHEKTRAHAAAQLHRFAPGSPARRLMRELAEDRTEKRLVRAQAQESLLQSLVATKDGAALRELLGYPDPRLRYEYVVGAALLENPLLDRLLIERFGVEQDEKVRKRLQRFKRDREEMKEIRRDRLRRGIR